MENQEFKEIAQIIDSVKFGMLSTLGKGNKIHSRPMTTSQIEDNGHIWFFTSIETDLVKEVSIEDNVQLSYAEPTNNVYISINGDAEIINDKAKKEELWTPLAKAWFPKGVDDPNLVLVKIKVNEAEVWDSGSNKILTLAKIVKAIFSSEKFESDEDSHKVIKM